MTIEPYKRSPQGGAPDLDDPRRCTAKSAASGDRCKRWAIAGHHVCPFHGGKNPMVKRRAQLRLLELVGPATAKLERILKETQDDRVALKAVEMIYDRTGLEAKSSSGVDAALAKELLLQRVMEMRGEAQPVTLDNIGDAGEEIFEAEIIDDGDGPSLEDLL